MEHGLVKATSTANGRRSRTDYAITAKGRKALRAWLGEPSAPPRLESEALLRLFFAEHGTKEGLLATLAELEAQALATGPGRGPGAPSTWPSGPPFPERIHILGLVGRFTLDHTALVAGWARWARAEVERWPDVARRRGQPRGGRAFRKTLRATGR